MGRRRGYIKYRKKGSYRRSYNYHKLRSYRRRASSATPAIIPLLLVLLVIFVPWLALLVAALLIVYSIVKYVEYKQGAYYQVTQNSFFSLLRDKGKYGEYLTYQHLRKYESYGTKFLFNIYLPKENGETSEVDVLMISPKGLFVFESKNYSGWIFGSENQLHWYQTLPAGRKSHKEQFYNPIMQNQTHIRYLQNVVGSQTPMHSIIVFSDRCTLKNIQLQTYRAAVVNRYNVLPAVSAIWDQTHADLLTTDTISKMYNTLYPFTQVDITTKAKHIANINNHLNKEVSPQTPPIPSQPFAVSLDPVKTTADTQFSNVLCDTVSAKEITRPAEIPETAKETPQDPYCPRCGGKLVLRKATTGFNAGNYFYGCSNYPKCKYIKDR